MTCDRHQRTQWQGYTASAGCRCWVLTKSFSLIYRALQCIESWCVFAWFSGDISLLNSGFPKRPILGGILAVQNKIIVITGLRILAFQETKPWIYSRCQILFMGHRKPWNQAVLKTDRLSKCELASKAQTQNPVEPVEPAVFWSQMQWVMTAPRISKNAAFRLEVIIVSPCQFSRGHPTICPSGGMHLRHPLDDLARDHTVCFGWAVWTWFLRLLCWPTMPDLTNL